MSDELPREAPMSPGVAEAWFRRLAERGALRLAFTLHARERLTERGVAIDGIHRLIRTGTVPAKPKRVDGLGRSKYAIEGEVAEDDPRRLRIVVIAAPRSPDVRVVTAMWVEERAVPD
jgi:hypothetical protein